MKDDKNNSSKKKNSIHSKLNPEFLSKITNIYRNVSAYKNSEKKSTKSSKKSNSSFTTSTAKGTTSFINSHKQPIQLEINTKQNSRIPTPPPLPTSVIAPAPVPTQTPIPVPPTPLPPTPKMTRGTNSQNLNTEIIHRRKKNSGNYCNPKQSIYPSLPQLPQEAPYPNYFYYPPIQANKQESTLLRKAELSGVLNYCYKHTELVVNKHYSFIKYTTILMSLFMGTITAFGIYLIRR